MFQEEYENIIKSFGALWKTKKRGDSIEIITPFATTSHSFVSVFLKKQNNEYVVSDGGWIASGLYGYIIDTDIDCFEKVCDHYIDTYDIKKVISTSGITFYYKKTDSISALASIVFDVSTFISTIVSLAGVQFVDDKDTREVFRRAANEFLSSIIPREKLDFRGYLDAARQIRINAIIQPQQSRLVLVNYLTGSNAYYFINSIAKVNMMFEMSANSIFSDVIAQRIALVDTNAQGYVGDRIQYHLGYMLNNTNAHYIGWDEKERLAQYV